MVKKDKCDDILKNKDGIGYFIECDLKYAKNYIIYIMITPLPLKKSLYKMVGYPHFVKPERKI